MHHSAMTAHFRVSSRFDTEFIILPGRFFARRNLLRFLPFDPKCTIT
jgi:hypothetical protein